MMIQAIGLLLISSVFMGIMSILRKEYQKRNSISVMPTVLFLFCVSIIGAGVSVAAGHGLHISGLSLSLAVWYAVISAVTTFICIYGTAFGNVSEILLFASLGNLVLPSLYGFIMQAADNRLTVYKSIGFLLAAVCMVINFLGGERKKSNAVYKLLCVLVFFSQGSALIILSLKNTYCAEISNYEFIAQHMLITIVIMTVILIVNLFKNKNDTINGVKRIFDKGCMVIILLYAVLFFSSDLLGMKCVGMIPLTVQATMKFCMPIITTAVLDRIFYKTKLTKTNVLQMILAFLCCICFAAEG